MHRLFFHPPTHSWILALDSLLYIPRRLDMGERMLEALALGGACSYGSCNPRKLALSLLMMCSVDILVFGEF